MKLRKTKFYTKEELLKHMEEAGLPHSYRWMLKMERLGKLVCPRTPSSNWRQFNEHQMKGILKAFAPGGKGYWKVNEEINEPVVSKIVSNNEGLVSVYTPIPGKRF